MPKSPITSKSDLITFSIKSDGNIIKDTYQVLSVYIDRAVNKIPYCELLIADGSASKEDFPISDSETFIPGAKIEVMAGYENSNVSIFKGIVVKHGIRISSDEGPALSVLCKDEAVKMTVGRKNAYFQKMMDSGIISKLIQNNGLTASVSSTENELKEVIQYYTSDWDFMVARADINGLITVVEDGKISVKKPEEETEEKLELTYGQDIFEFDADIDAQNQLKSVKSNAWDMASQAIISSESSTSNFDQGNLSTSDLAKVIGLEDYDLQSGGFLENDMLSTWAKAKSTKSQYSKIRGTVKFQGSALALPGTLIGFKGLGKRFNGKGFVSGVIHEIANGNWITTAEIGLSPEWFSAKVKTEAPLASGLLPGIQGLQIGKVRQINDDPDGEFRVLITLPLIQSGDDGVWARLASFYATSDSGAFFYPEVEDEVVVGFLNDDPRYPVILGSLYSSGRATPETPDEKNTIKAFVSREKMKITFDEENKVITITTPNSNQLVFSDKETSITMTDQNNNFIKLSSDGIELNSASDIKITAAESITMDGPSGITESASGGTISLSATTISCSADAEFSASGDASAGLSSSAEVSINGAMVMINS
ncbi:MAG: type VI secretion system tip protein VgrG [Saprospiraceae bacterium]